MFNDDLKTGLVTNCYKKGGSFFKGKFFRSQVVPCLKTHRFYIKLDLGYV